MGVAYSGGAFTEKRHHCEGTRGKLDSLVPLPTKLSPPKSASRIIHGAGVSTMPFPHTIHLGAGGAASSCSLNFMVWPLPWDGAHRAILKAYVCFLAYYEAVSTRALQPITRATPGRSRTWTARTSMVSLSLPYGPVMFGVACRMHRLLSNTLCSEGWRGPRSGSLNSILGDGQFFPHRHEKKKSKKFTAVIRIRTLIALVVSIAAMVP